MTEQNNKKPLSERWKLRTICPLSSVQFRHSVVSDSLRPHVLQHARPPCPSPIPGAYLNLCPLSQSWHPTISSCHPLLLPPSIFSSIRVFPSSTSDFILIYFIKFVYLFNLSILFLLIFVLFFLLDIFLKNRKENSTNDMCYKYHKGLCKVCQ